MKKIALALVAAGLFAGTAGAAFADRVDVPGVGYAATGDDAGGDTLYLEGNNDNGLGPLSGFVQVQGDGGACADDNGSKDNGDATPDSSSPTCTP